MIYDNHGRIISYLRLAVTDRCNLRCHYCMPEHGLEWLSRSELLSYEEMLRICRVLVDMGIEKIRITGGEPFARKDLIKFLEKLSQIPGLKQITLTTNGVALAPFIPRLKALGITQVNLSLDTLDRERFFQISRRDELPAVLQTLDLLLRHDFQVKINAVVMHGINHQDILPLAKLSQALPVDVRFIEEMPFNGGDHESARPFYDFQRILSTLQEEWPDMFPLENIPGATALSYQIPGFLGRTGIIAAWTRSFCGTCNRIRITPQGVLKTCLYDNGVLNIRDAIREGIHDEALAERLKKAFAARYRDGWEAEKATMLSGARESMAMIGG